MGSATLPYHPLVVSILKSARVEGGTSVTLPPDLLASCKSSLQTDLADDRQVFLQLLVIWADFAEHHFEPATSQLFELVALWSQIQANASREELLIKAQHARAQLTQSSTERAASTLAPKGAAGFGLRPKKKQP